MILLKKLKKDTYGDLIDLKCYYKSRLGIIFLKMLKEGMGKVRLGSYSVQKAKTRYVWHFNLFKMLK